MNVASMTTADEQMNEAAQDTSGKALMGEMSLCKEQSYCRQRGVCYELRSLGRKFCLCHHGYLGYRCSVVDSAVHYASTSETASGGSTVGLVVVGCVVGGLVTLIAVIMFWLLAKHRYRRCFSRKRKMQGVENYSGCVYRAHSIDPSLRGLQLAGRMMHRFTCQYSDVATQTDDNSCCRSIADIPPAAFEPPAGHTKSTSALSVLRDSRYTSRDLTLPVSKNSTGSERVLRIDETVSDVSLELSQSCESGEQASDLEVHRESEADILEMDGSGDEGPDSRLYSEMSSQCDYDTTSEVMDGENSMERSQRLLQRLYAYPQLKATGSSTGGSEADLSWDEFGNTPGFSAGIIPTLSEYLNADGNNFVIAEEEDMWKKSDESMQPLVSHDSSSKLL